MALEGQAETFSWEIISSFDVLQQQLDVLNQEQQQQVQGMSRKIDNTQGSGKKQSPELMCRQVEAILVVEEVAPLCCHPVVVFVAPTGSCDQAICKRRSGQSVRLPGLTARRICSADDLMSPLPIDTCGSSPTGLTVE
eukprot:4607198-Amphidinium_carterae.1